MNMLQPGFSIITRIEYPAICNPVLPIVRIYIQAVDNTNSLDQAMRIGKHARNATRLWRLARACCPFKPQRVLSDSASQFKADFTKTVLNDVATRWPTCPNCPAEV